MNNKERAEKLREMAQLLFDVNGNVSDVAFELESMACGLESGGGEKNCGCEWGICCKCAREDAYKQIEDVKRHFHYPRAAGKATMCKEILEDIPAEEYKKYVLGKWEEEEAEGYCEPCKDGYCCTGKGECEEQEDKKFIEIPEGCFDDVEYEIDTRKAHFWVIYARILKELGKMKDIVSEMDSNDT